MHQEDLKEEDLRGQIGEKNADTENLKDSNEIQAPTFKKIDQKKY